MAQNTALESKVKRVVPHLRPVLRGAVAGKRNRTFARETGLAIHTVENYMSEILAEFEYESRAER